ncbi:MAG TPA: TlpA disulfide reductase family protein [Solirubrobacteraceae bacterium]|jgi:cytochrome c biogenesis protein CcmG/thiol:disulfide interchange protein DsbE|nr:TlpA disulfide reductase family protein [Solirubrobacteraceae bacterium]
MRRFVLPGVIVTAAVAILALLTFGVSSHGDTASLDAQVASHRLPLAPNAHLALPVLGSSATKSLADFRGKVVVLNVFASWCEPCQGEAPLLSAEQHSLVKHGATLLGVTYLDNPISSEQFARRYHIDYPVLRDVSGSFVRGFGTTGVPETFVINPDGRITALQRYPVNSQWFSQTLTPVLGKVS